MLLCALSADNSLGDMLHMQRAHDWRHDPIRPDPADPTHLKLGNSAMNGSIKLICLSALLLLAIQTSRA